MPKSRHNAVITITVLTADSMEPSRCMSHSM